MRPRIITRPARLMINANAFHIAANNPAAADRYLQSVEVSFLSLPDLLMPRRAHRRLPENVRAINVKGLNGYILHVAYLPDALYLLAAYMPGLPDHSIIGRTRKGLKDV